MMPAPMDPFFSPTHHPVEKRSLWVSRPATGPDHLEADRLPQARPIARDDGVLYMPRGPMAPHQREL